MPDKELLLKLCGLSAPTGRETAVADALGDCLSDCETRVDCSGNLLIHCPGNGSRVMITAPMDEAGFIVKSWKNGFAKPEPVGKFGPAQAFGRPVAVAGQTGVVGVCPIHLAENKNVYPKTLTLELPEEAVPGEFGALCAPPMWFGQEQGLLCGRAAAARAALCVMAELARGFAGGSDLWLVAAARGGLGGVGARTAAESIRPAFAIILQGMPKEGVFDPGEDPELYLPVLDSGAVHDTALLDLLRKTADTLKITLRIPKERPAVPASAVAQLCGGIRTAAIGLPARLMGSESEYCRMRDVEALSTLLATAAGLIK